MHFDVGMNIAERSAVVGESLRNALQAEINFLDFAQLVESLVRVHSMRNEATLSVVQNAEILFSFIDAYNV